MRQLVLTAAALTASYCWAALPASFNTTIYFPKDSARLGEKQLGILGPFACTSMASEAEVVIVEGHASGDEKAPKQLAERRALAVKSILVRRGLLDSQVHVQNRLKYPFMIGAGPANRSVEVEFVGRLKSGRCPNAGRDTPIP